MFTTAQFKDITIQAAERFARRLPELEAAQNRAPSTSEVYLAAAQAKDKTRALIAEASAATNPASQTDTIRTLSQERVIGKPDFRDVNYLEFAIAVARGISRVNLTNGFGTGSLIGPRLLLTNHHVIETPGDAMNATAEFDYQDDVNGVRLQMQSFACDPDHFFFTDPNLDFTVVGLAERSQAGVPIANYPWTRLIGTPGKTSVGLPINIIQHPKGGLKQIVFRNNEVIEIPSGKPDFLYYTTDTEPGSSGSPCFTDGWDMVALHHSGVPKIENGEIVGWIANEGVRVSAMVAALKHGVRRPDLIDRLAQALESTPPNPIEVGRLSSSGSRPPHAGVVSAAGGTTATWSIPVTFQVTVGCPVMAEHAPQVRVEQVQQKPTPAAQPSEALEGLKVDPFSTPRGGFDEDFLSWAYPIPLPALSNAQEADSVEVPEQYRRHHGAHVLDYHHYSVAMCKSRKFAWYSAAMIDGDNVPKLPKRSGDTWNVDPRIEPDPAHPIHQFGEDLYAERNTDRGHLTRYLDLAWGDTAEIALSAMADTFHFTNCTLQLDVFNQGKERWQGLERFLLEEHARKDRRRLIVITGPVLKKSDPYYRNRFMKGRAQLPIAFWKVCAIVRADDSLAVTAFVMDQRDVVELPGFEERFDVIATQRTVKYIEDLTGLRFGVLRDHDHFATGGAPGTLEVAREGTEERFAKPILDYRDIVVD